MMLKPVFLLMFLFLVSGLACVDMKSKQEKPLVTVDKVELPLFLGRWYEIARYPNRFQKGCSGSRATYTMRKDDKISVLNECYEQKSGKLRQAKGKAWVVDKTTNAKLKVSFFWPFSGDYWIIDLGEDYEYAVVGHPKRKYLWILSRTKEMDSTLLHTILSMIEEQGYDPSLLIWSEHHKQSIDSGGYS